MKPRTKSKTHWIGGLVTVLGVVVQNEATLLPLFGSYGGLVMSAIGGAMIVLRELTKEPLKPLVKPDSKID